MEKIKTAPSVLIVDDEPMLRSLFADVFADAGFSVREAENGTLALQATLAEPFDVIVSDIRMPGGSGLDLLKNLRARDVAKPPIIFMTGYADADAEQVYASGAEAVFYKPFKQKDLVHAALRLAKPFPERWGGAPPLETAVEFSATHDSLEAAIAAHRIGVGRGGFFLAYQDPAFQIGETAKFRLSFEGGSLPVLEGFGVVRWIRASAGVQSPQGVGIEILQLADSCRVSFIALEARRTSVAFIPAS